MSALNWIRFQRFCQKSVKYYSLTTEHCVFTVLQTITAIYSIGRQWRHFEWRDLCIQDRGERSGGQGRRPSTPRQNYRGMWPTMYGRGKKHRNWCALDGEVGLCDSCCLPYKDDDSEEAWNHHSMFMFLQLLKIKPRLEAANVTRQMSAYVSSFNICFYKSSLRRRLC